MLSPDSVFGLTVRELSQQGWRCDSRQRGQTGGVKMISDFHPVRER